VAIDHEISCLLDATMYCRENGLKSFATPEAALLSIARHLTVRKESFGPHCQFDSELCRGILSSLRRVVERQEAEYEACIAHHKQTGLPMPETAEYDKDPRTAKEDPRGNDYFCMICHAELSNVYYHCAGCEDLFDKDFNICAGCYLFGKHKRFVQMHPIQAVAASCVNHTGGFTNKDDECRCNFMDDGPCHECSLCGACCYGSCQCHMKFHLRYRTMLPEELAPLLSAVEDMSWRKRSGSSDDGESSPQHE